MKIKNRLSLNFTLIYAAVILIILAFSYYTLYEFSYNDFYTQLEERAFITSRVFLKEDELSHDLWLPYKNKFLQKKIEDEIIQVYDVNNNYKEAFIEKSNQINISKNILNNIKNKNELRFSQGKRQFYGMFIRDNQGDFVIVASAIDKEDIDRLYILLTTMLIVYFTSIIIIYFLGRYFAKNTLNPITNIVKQVKQITAKNLKVRVDEGENKDEINELASTFNNVLEKLESSFEIQKTFVSNASHELRTPLTTIIAELELMLLKDREKEEYKDSIIDVLAEVQQLKNFINNLLSIASTSISDSNTKLDEIRLDETLMDIKRDLTNKKSNANIKIELSDLPEDTSLLTIHGNKQLLTNAFMNLIENAIKFSDNKEILCSLTYKKKRLKLNIIDHGVGISEKDLKNIFQPFYRASNVTEYPGHGIGLSLSEKIIRLHGGRIFIESIVNVGTKVEITFIPHTSF